MDEKQKSVGNLYIDIEPNTKLLCIHCFGQDLWLKNLINYLFKKHCIAMTQCDFSWYIIISIILGELCFFLLCLICCWSIWFVTCWVTFFLLNRRCSEFIYTVIIAKQKKTNIFQNKLKSILLNVIPWKKFKF